MNVRRVGIVLMEVVEDTDVTETMIAQEEMYFVEEKQENVILKRHGDGSAFP